MGYLSKRKFEERERYFITGLLIIIPLLTLLGTLGRSLDWRLDYLGEFKVQAAFLSLLLFVWCLFKQRWIEMSVFFILAVMNLALVTSHYHLTEKESTLPDDSYLFTVLYQNLKDADDKSEQISRILESSDADIVLWANVPAEVYRRLNDIKGPYTLQNQTFDKSGRMKLVLARTPGTARGEIGDKEAIWVSRVIGTRKLTFVLAALDNPWSEKNYGPAKKEIFDIADFARSRDEPVVVVGGFGAAGWSYLLRDLEKHAGLQSQGTVVLTSSPDKPFFLRRPADHIYTHPGIEVHDLRMTKSLGTDYSGLTATLKIAPVKKEIEFFELQPTLPEEELLQPPV